ncbi:hypothetical protein C5F47_05235 [Nitrosopumilus cobalaminigenes]|uniref:Uncharacterized protein n=1 Tax=Nitrosopumilus cobalaminigenes TaxID=1470066 RepID=A0A7D5LZ91_9ARCH|nr:hypothetical protein [Nitrosopumilus cobalaminigenes]QLH02994.1 hypothetical protein C5F47_05235 [Nitrosopumilus cobalaminigenes]
MKTWKALVISSSVIIVASLLFFYMVNLLMFSESFSEPGSRDRDKILIGAIGCLFFIFIGVVSLLSTFRFRKFSS